MYFTFMPLIDISSHTSYICMYFSVMPLIDISSHTSYIHVSL